jgi:hypothetical protein
VAIKVRPPGKHVEFRFLLSSQDGLTPWDIIAKLGGAETAEEDIPTDGEPAESNEEGASEEAHKVALACMARSVQVIYAIASEMTSRNRATLTRGQVRGITRKALGELAGSPSRVTNEDINATFGMLTESSCIVCMTGGEYYLGSRAFGTVIEFIPEGCTSEQAEIILDGLKAFLTLGPYVTLRNQTWTVRGELDGHRLEAERLEAKAEGIRGRIRELQAQASELERLKTGETTAIESCQRVIDGAEAVLDGVKIDESLATVEFALLDVITAPPKVSNS